MCSHSSGSKSGSTPNTSLARYADSIVFHIVVARDLHTVRSSLLPLPNEDGGSHRSQSCTPAHALASGAALSGRGSSAKVLYVLNGPFNSATMPSAAQILVTAGNWVSSLNALMMASVFKGTSTSVVGGRRWPSASIGWTITILNELHPAKAPTPMLVTEDGISRYANALHPLNA